MEKLEKVFQKVGKSLDKNAHASCIAAYKQLDEKCREFVCWQIECGDTFAQALGFYYGKFRDPIETLTKALKEGRQGELNRRQQKSFQKLSEYEQAEVCIQIAEFGKGRKEAFEKVQKYGCEHYIGRYESPGDLAYEQVQEGLWDIRSDHPILQWVDWDRMGDDLMLSGISSWNPDDGEKSEFYFYNY